jgi:hypothetical protein
MDFTSVITNFSKTDNGALTHASTLNPQVDLFSEFVSANDSKRETLVSEALKDDKIKAVKVLFYLRNPRGGQGIKDAIQYILKMDRDEIEKLLPFIVEFGSWKDINKLFERSYNTIALQDKKKKDLKKLRKTIVKFY